MGMVRFPRDGPRSHGISLFGLLGFAPDNETSITTHTYKKKKQSPVWVGRLWWLPWLCLFTRGQWMVYVYAELRMLVSDYFNIVWYCDLILWHTTCCVKRVLLCPESAQPTVGIWSSKLADICIAIRLSTPVGGFGACFSPFSWECVIIPTDELIFFRGVRQPPTSTR